jgi:type 1 glutamine amidotransferase
LIGGQFVAHPPGWPDNLQPKEDYIDYDVTICQPDHPLVEGIKSFRITSEQYYMLTDPSNNVLATTTFSGDNLWWIEGTVIPVTWTRRWDKGRVFYCSIGHELDDLKVPQVTEMIRRGAIWAARGKADARYLSLAAPVRSDHTFQIGSQIVATASNELSAFLDLGFDHL